MNSFCKKFNTRLTNTLRSSLHKRMEKYDNEEIFRIATVLNPRWKLGWCKEDEVTEMKHIILERGREFSNSSEESASASQESQDSPPRKKSKLFEFMHENVAKNVVMVSYQKLTNTYLVGQFMGMISPLILE